MRLLSFLGFGSKGLTSDPSTNNFQKYSDLVDTAYVYTNKQQEICQDKYKLGNYESWFLDQDKGLLTFSNAGQVKLRIKYESVGSLSLSSSTWLWAWNNKALDEKTTTETLIIKKFGQRNNFGRLIEPKWTAEEADGWEMAAIASYLLKAKGTYRLPADNIYLFVIFMEIEMIE